MPEAELVTSALLRDWSLPDPGAEKHSRGEVLVVGGGRPTPGAAILAGESALRVGAGQLQVATAESIAVPMAIVLPEALVRGFPEAPSGDVAAGAADEIAEMANGVSATLLGPGLLDKDCAVELLEKVVPQIERGVVLDALASAYVTEHRDGLQHLDGQCVMTLNPTELARTLGVEVDEVEAEPERLSRELASTTGAVVVCGGTDKVVAAPDGQTFRIVRGGRGLGISGSGDVQAGLVTGLLARGASPLQAAVWGGFLHGAAGEELARTTGDLGFLARELPGVVPGLLRSLQD